MKTYQKIARELDRKARGEKLGKPHWVESAEEALEQAMQSAPSGSGFDAGTSLSDSSAPNRLVFVTQFHHMNEGGFYCGWSEHLVVVTPNLAWDFNVRVTGRDRNGVKEYILDTFNTWLGGDEA